MDERKKITVKLSDQLNDDRPLESFEEAASVDDIPEFTYKHTHKGKGKKSLRKYYGKKQNTALKSFGITALIAIVVGVSLGYIILRMFVVTEEAPLNPSTPTTSVQQDADNSTSTPASGETRSMHELPALQGYIVQAGVFSSIEQAESFQENLEQAGVHSAVWATGEDVRLFTGVYSSEMEAKSVTESDQVDLYARTWSTEAKEAEISEAVANWLTGFAQLWTSSLDGMTDEILGGWQEWLQTAPDDLPESTIPLYQDVDQFISQPNSGQVNVELVNWWHHYNQI